MAVLLAAGGAGLACWFRPPAQPPWEAVLIPPVLVEDKGAIQAVDRQIPSAPGPLPAVLTLPPGRGPFPIVIVLHDCGAAGHDGFGWPARLTGWGYAVLEPDSLTPRHLALLCDPGRAPDLTPARRLEDVAAALAWSRTRGDIDPRRVALLGHGHGGATAVLASNTSHADNRIRAVIDYDGACEGARSARPVPLLVLAGERDGRGIPASTCADLARRSGEDGTIEVHTYPSLGANLENWAAGGRARYRRVLEYDPVAAADGYERVRAFLDRWLARQDAGTGTGR